MSRRKARSDGGSGPTFPISPVQTFPGVVIATSSTELNTIAYGANGTSLNMVAGVPTFSTPISPLKYYAESSTPPTVLPTATGSRSVAIGTGAQANGSDTFSCGQNSGLSNVGSRNVFIGARSGNGSINASSCVMIGYGTGSGSNAIQMVAIGQSAGNGNNSSYSVAIGSGSGQNATSAGQSVMIGYGTGANAANAANSIVLGSFACLGGGNPPGQTLATVNNTAGFDESTTFANTSIAIGHRATPGAFSNSIALGAYAKNTAANQLIIGSNGANNQLNNALCNVGQINDARIIGTGAFMPQVGTTVERPTTPIAGMMRYNSTTNKHEGYNGTTWNDFY